MYRSIRSTMIIVCWLSIAVPATHGAQESSLAQESSVHGRVYGQQPNGDHIGPVAGAVVILQSANSSDKLSATVSEAGYYQIENVAPGQYTYSISAKGYRAEDEGRGIEFSETGAHVLDFVLTRDVPEETDKPKEPESRGEGELIVKVFEDTENGERKPAEGAQVSIRGKDSSDVISAKCDSAGLCRFSLAEGDVRLRASATDRKKRSSAGTAKVDSKSSTTVELVLTAPRETPADSAPASETDATFFGTRAKGESVVYVVDNSLSMKDGKFETASAELVRSVENLSSEQKFYVIFFSDTLHPMYEPDSPQGLVPVNRLNIERLQTFTENLRLVRQTNAKPALDKAFALDPDIIYILSDGAFTDDTNAYLLEKPAGRTKIHTISFTPRQRAIRNLKTIAERHGGTYTEIP